MRLDISHAVTLHMGGQPPCLAYLVIVSHSFPFPYFFSLSIALGWGSHAGIILTDEVTLFHIE